MVAMILKVRFAIKEHLLKSLRRCRATGVCLRYLVVHVLNGHSVAQAQAVLALHHTTIYRILKRFQTYGEPGLWDARVDNGLEKVDDDYWNQLDPVVRATPHDYGWCQPTWTRELLLATLLRRTDVRIHVATMRRAMARIKARRGRPRPRVRCPWAKAATTRHLNAMQKVLATLPRREHAFYENEVDLHLNSKIGLAWMVQGQLKDVPTLGTNQKRYLAGAWGWARACSSG